LPEGTLPSEKMGQGQSPAAAWHGCRLDFKGTGFYITDYRSSNYTEGAKKDAPAPKAATETKSADTKKPASEKPKSKKE
jgi:predicted nucleic acid-binding Zn ribbon protein